MTNEINWDWVPEDKAGSLIEGSMYDPCKGIEMHDYVWDFGPPSPGFDKAYTFRVPADRITTSFSRFGTTNRYWMVLPSLDERFADFKARLAIALKKYGMDQTP